jgi:CHAT domain/Carbohydrate family 9 binding domain-like
MTEEKTYADFDLLIEGSGGEGYRARVLESPAGGGEGTFTLPFTDMELELFLLKVGRPRRGTRRLESPEMEAARDFGRKLYDAVFHDELRLSLRRSLDEVERRDEGLRIRLRFSDAPELASLPWEFLYDATEDQFLVLSAWTPIVRYLDLTQRVEPLTVTAPLRILTMISSPHDYPPLDVDEEWRRIELALAPLIERGAVHIGRTEEATLLELQRRLRRDDYHIFHFVGHGGFDERADDGVLVMEDGQNRSRLVAGRDLGTILNDHRSLRLAVLNACEGARAAEDDPFSGAAQSVVRKGIPAVVAMQFEITDNAAIAFAQEFYGAIADSYPVDAAIGEARRAIFGLGNDIEWGTPVVYMRGDGRLFDVQLQPAPVGEEAGDAVDEVESASEEVMVEEPGWEAEEVGATAAAIEVVAEPEPPAGSPPVVGELVETPPQVVAGEAAVAPSLSERLAALPLWLKIALGGAAALVAVLLAVSLFAGDGTTETTVAGAEEGTTVAGGAGTTAATDTTLEAATVTTVIAPEGEALAQRTALPKVIDGSADDWTEGVVHTADHVIYNDKNIVNGTVARAGTENESSTQLAWDGVYLYVLARVRDDIASAPNEGNQIWRNDAVNLNLSVIAADGSISERPDADDHQLTLSPGYSGDGTTEESVRFVGNGERFDANFVGFADVVAARDDGDYVLEARIPWASIGVSNPQAGQRFGLIITVFDNDGETVNGQTLQSEIKANTPGAEFQRPQTWGTLTLEE